MSLQEKKSRLLEKELFIQRSKLSRSIKLGEDITDSLSKILKLTELSIQLKKQ